MADKKNFVLRIDQVSYKALEKWAADEFRSVNGQIEFILHQALKEQYGPQFQQKFGGTAKNASPTDHEHLEENPKKQPPFTGDLDQA